MKISSLYFILIFCSIYRVHGQISCPENITQSCFSDLWPDQTGMATVWSGNYSNAMIKYTDDDSGLDLCNQGVLLRTFYIDIDYNNTQDNNEPGCTQVITLEKPFMDIAPQFPGDKIYACEEDIVLESPTWNVYECDLVGYTYDDEVIDFSGGACKKILRHFTLINWCYYDPNTGSGIWNHTQIIKIIDDTPPELLSCENVVVPAVEDCSADVVLTNMAFEGGACPSGLYKWSLSVDLWGDGTQDLFFGPEEPVPFRLPKTGLDQEISVALPNPVGTGHHKAIWKVTDGCSNVKSCHFDIDVVDAKAPTPYCRSLLSITIDGTMEGGITITPDAFDLGGIDNCTPGQDLKVSFSSNIDDVTKTLDCSDTGFNFFRIYYTDQAGNQDFCEAFILAFDNGSCGAKFAPRGYVEDAWGRSLPGVEISFMDGDWEMERVVSDQNGEFLFSAHDLRQEYSATASMSASSMEGINLKDYLYLRDALVGLKDLSLYQKIAADINEDGRVGIDDLVAFRDALTGHGDGLLGEWVFLPASYEDPNQSLEIVFPTKIPYTQYEGGFYFVGVKKGDLVKENQKKLDTKTLMDYLQNDTKTNENPALKIYPVPFSNQFTIEGNGIQKVEVYNLWGEPLNVKVEVSPTQCKVSGFKGYRPGIYYMKVKINDVRTFHKIIKNH